MTMTRFQIVKLREQPYLPNGMAVGQYHDEDGKPRVFQCRHNRNASLITVSEFWNFRISLLLYKPSPTNA